MSIIAMIADGAISLLQQFASKSTVLGTVAGISVTAGDAEASLGTIGGFLTAMQAAIAAKNYEAEAELSIDEAATIASDLGVPYAGLAATVLPLLWPALNAGITAIAATKLVPDGRGGFVTQAWAADPREQLNPDGSFKN